VTANFTKPKECRERANNEGTCDTSLKTLATINGEQFTYINKQ
jgi:hypothetical protein